MVRRLFFAAAILALASTGCATAKAKPRVEPAALEVPAPPPRVIVPPGPEAIEPKETTPGQDLKTEKPRVKPATPRPKPEPARPAEPPAADPPPAAAPPAATLQQKLPDTPEKVTRDRVEEWLKQAGDDLRSVNRNALNAEAKSQYDTARQFITQAEQARDEGNLVFAAKVAEKAAGLAAGLRRR